MPDQQNMATTDQSFSTSIQLTRGKIHYRIEDKWIEFPVNSIQVIGEFSAPHGILPADYFFSFKLRGQDGQIDVPAYTEGLFEALAELKKELPGVNNPRLQMSTDFDSNVLYPAHVAGMQMYEFSQVEKPWINLPILKNIATVQRVVKGINPEVMAAVY